MNEICNYSSSVFLTSIQISAVEVVCVNLVMYDWWEEIQILKEEWRCVQKMFGEQCVAMAGTTEMPVSYVLNWDCHQEVNKYS